MSKYKAGDKFIVEVKEVMESEKGTLYRADFSTLVFDDYGLDKLPKYCEAQERLELIDELKQVEYNKGLNDAWEFIFNKTGILTQSEVRKIFDCEWAMIGDNYTPQEALAKLKAYEESQSKIEVGDIVLIYGERAVVTRVVDGYANIIFADGVTNNMSVKDLVGDKTGKHIDITSILEQIREV